MTLDDQLRAAADDVRQNVDGLSTPPFQPRSSGGPRVVAAIAAAILGVAGWFGATSLLADDGQDLDTVSPATAQSATSEPPRRADDAAEPSTDAASSAAAAPPTSAAPSTTTEPPPTEPESPVPLAGVTDTAVYPLSELARPGLEPTVEPDFGSSIQRLTSAGLAKSIMPTHSSTQVFNVDGSFFMLYEAGVGHVLFSGTDFTEIGPLIIDSVDIEDYYWDSVDPNTMYFVRQGTNELVALDVTTAQQTTKFIFDDCDVVDTGTSSGSTNSASPIIGFRCQDADGDSQAMAYDTENDVLIGPVDLGSGAAPQAFASGRGFLIVEGSTVTTYDASLSPDSGRVIYDSPVRAISVGRDADGRDVMVATLFQDKAVSGLAVGFDLATGERWEIISEANVYGFPSAGSKVTAASASQRYLVAIAGLDGPSALLANELMVIDMADPSTVRRIGRHRMGEPDQPLNRWSGVRAAISPDGTKVLFSSDWGLGESIDTYLIDLTRPTDS